MKKILIHIMLVLSHSKRLRVDLDKLGKRIHQTSSDRHSATHCHVMIRKFSSCDL